MNEQEKQAYLEKYHQAKEKGGPFFPDVLFKDAVIALAVFLLLVALAYFVGAPLEERANPADSTYTPRPEWYFLFLFQLLKYFPGDLEVIGVVVIPTLAIALLFLLPFLDRGPRRHFTARPGIILITILLGGGIVFLTIQSALEAPPPAEASAGGDPTAALYADNCAGCHGSTINVSAGTNLHDIIAQGSHEGMPVWNADLTSDEIDALAGFILSPAGSELFSENCGDCHEVLDLVASDPIQLKDALDDGAGFEGPIGVEVPKWSEVLSREERTSLLNFLVAPDGQRLFTTNCSSCHGRSVAFDGTKEELRTLINEGGLHLEMPPWQEKLSASELDELAQYVVDPDPASPAADLFERHCTRCHGQRIPAANDITEAREIIATGGAHETMPLWGDILTSEQIDALVDYTLAAAQGTPLELGQTLFADNCAGCHGDFGEGGENPSRPDDVIAPISTAEYLKTRDDATLTAIISQGQPNFGMSPFSSAFGGPLDDDEINALVTYIRSWEADPPVELPPEVFSGAVDLTAQELFVDVCAQCHGLGGEGTTGPSLRDSEFRTTNTSQDIFNTIDQGHSATDMIAWGAILTSEQIQQLVDYIDQLPIDEAKPEPTAEGETTATEEISFANDAFPILDAKCTGCHPSDGGWDATTYDLLMTTGDHSPVVVPGDVENSLMAQKLLETHTEGDRMPPPPMRRLSDQFIQVILDWIAAGAPDN